MSPQAEHAHRPSEIDLLTQIAELLQNSTISEERGQDALSKFWVAYKKVSSEYDGDMLEGCNGNMDIVLIFAGLFSAVNTAFIIAMQPNPVDTTNTLLLTLIQISLYGPSAVHPATLSTSTGYSSATFWTQALAYASLALSLLAALGAVLGKQWLSYYKANCYGRGSLEARCKQRHRKFQTLQSWQFQRVLQSFPILLQMSLLLFGLSIGAALWTQQQVISSLVLGATVFGLLCHVFTIVVSVISPDCPFQTPVSLAIQAVLRHFKISLGRQSPDENPTASAMQWILETSTNPDVVRSAVELMPTMSKPPEVDIVSLCEDVRDMFKACFDHRGLAIIQDSALAYGKALIHFSSHHRGARDMLYRSTHTPEWNLWRSWRTMYLVPALKQCATSYNRMRESDNAGSSECHQADIRTALRMAVTTGFDGFTDPDNERLIWDGQFLLPSFDSREEISHAVDDLLRYMAHFYDTDDLDVAADALLIASGIATATTTHPDICRTICYRLIPLLNTTLVVHGRWRRVALGAARRFLDSNPHFGYEELFSQVVLIAAFPPLNAVSKDDLPFANAIDLLNFTEWPEGNDLKRSHLPEIQRLVLHALPTPKADNATQYVPYCRALIRLMGANNHSRLRRSALHIAWSARENLDLIAAIESDEPQRAMVISELSPALLTAAGDNVADYFCLISTLARSPAWCSRLITDDHVKKCITLITNDEPDNTYFHLAEFFFRIAPLGQELPSCCGNITNQQWWTLMKTAWDSIASCVPMSTDEDTIDVIRNLVRGTETYIPQDLSKKDLKLLGESLDGVLDRLIRAEVEGDITPALTCLKEMVESRIEAL